MNIYILIQSQARAFGVTIIYKLYLTISLCARKHDFIEHSFTRTYPEQGRGADLCDYDNDYDKDNDER